jgi:hypothetical protein
MVSATLNKTAGAGEADAAGAGTELTAAEIIDAAAAGIEPDGQGFIHINIMYTAALIENAGAGDAHGGKKGGEFAAAEIIGALAARILAQEEIIIHRVGVAPPGAACRCCSGPP